MLPSNVAPHPAESPAPLRPRHGWFQLAFVSQVPEGISSWKIGALRLILVRAEASIRCFDANCPHRGAHLGVSGRLEDNAIVCSYHGYRIGLGAQACSGRFMLREFPTLVVGCMVLVRVSEERQFDLEAVLAALTSEHSFVEALHLEVRAPMSLVIENGFDARHFEGIHGITVRDFEVAPRARGGLQARGLFLAPFRQRRDGTPLTTLSPVPFEADAFSPGLILVRLGGDHPYGVMTGATDRGDGSCEVRLTFVLPKAAWGDTPDPQRYQPLIRYSRAGIEDDRRVWESIAPDFVPDLVPEDRSITRFRAFCADFY